MVESDRYRLHEQVALRPEPFGALAYHYGNRKLVFLRSPQMVTLVRSLGEHESVSAALDAAGVAPPRRAAHLAALASLERSEMLVRTPPAAAGDQTTALEEHSQ